MGKTDNDVGVPSARAHRLLGCDWEADLPTLPHETGDEHVLTAQDFVVDEFEMYGLGD